MKNFTKFYKNLRQLFLGFSGGLALLLSSCTIGLGSVVDIERPTLKIDDAFTNYTVKGPFTLSGTCYDDRGVTDLIITVRSSGSDKYLKEYRYSEQAAGDNTIQIIRNQKEVEEKGNLVTKDILDPELNRRIDTWSIRLNEITDGKYPLQDGKYIISVKAVDENNSTPFAIERLTSMERSFTVDNTAPVLVLSRPGLGDSGDGDLYGRTFNVSGRVADDGNIEKMEIEVHDANVDLSANPDAEPLCIIPLSNLAPSIDINAAIADQEQNDDNGNKIDFYKKMYGINQNIKIEDSELTTKKYQCRIRVYDDARFYPAVANDKGNCSSTFFLDSDEKIKEYADYYTISDLYHILNDTYEGSASRLASSTSGVEQVKEWLLNRESSTSDSHKFAYFSLNPENSPKYTLQGGYTPLTEGFESFRNITVSEGETLSVKIDTGCDDISLVKDSLGVYAVKTIADGSTWKVDTTEEELVLVPSLIDEDGKTVNLSAEEKAARESAFETQGSSYIISAKIGKDYGIRAGSSYKIVVKGKDKYNKINNGSKAYGFFFTAKGSAPTLNLEKSADGTDKFKSTEYANATRIQSLVLSGEAYHAEETPVVKLFVYKDDVNILGTGEEEPYYTPALSSEGKFSLSLKDYVTDTTHNAEYRIKMYAEVSGNNKSGEIDKTLIYDITAPEIEVSSITPVVEVEEGGVTKKYVNGKIKIKVSFQDKESAVDVDTIDYFYSLTADVNKSYQADIKKAGERTPQNNWEITLDTTTLEDEKDLNFTFTVKDKAGNETVLPLTYKVASTDTNYKVSQATDTPVINLSGIYENVAENQITKDKNSIIQGARLNGYVSDDDGLSEVKITCQSCETNAIVVNETKTLANKDLKGVTDEKYLLTQALPAVKGNYKLVITTKDIYEKENSYTTYIKIKGAAPEIVSLSYDTPTITATSNGKKSLKVIGKVLGERDTVAEDATAAEKLKANLKIWVSKDGSVWETVPAWQAGSSFENNIETVWECLLSDNVNYPDLLSSEEGSHTLYFKAEDGAETTSSVKSLSYKIDNTKPVVDSIKRTNGNEIGDYITISPFQFDPETSDSGAEVAYFWQVTKTVPAAVTAYSDLLNEANGWKKAAAGKTFSFEFAEGVSATGEGPYTIYIHAVDAAENFSDLKTQNFTADRTKPTASFTNTSVQNTKTPITLAYTTNDGISGVKTIEIKEIPPSGSEHTKTFKYNSENNNWVYQKQGQPDEETTVFPSGTPEQGTYTFEISAQDNAGLLSEKADGSRYSFIYDTVSPQTELEVSEMLKHDYGTDPSIVTRTNVVNGKITIKGNTDDDTSKVKSVTLKVFSGTDISAAGTVLYTLSSDGAEFKNGISESSNTVITADSGNTKDSFTFVLDTTKLADIATYSIVLDATDNAGNAAVQNVSEIYVDQSTDKPTLKIQEPVDTSIKDKTNVNKNKNGKNLFGASGEKINLTAQDDDGSPTVTVTCFSESGTKVNEKTYTDENISYTLPAAEGFYRIVASVKDKYGIAGTSENAYEFWVGLTSGAPSVEIENNNKVYVKGTSQATAEPVTINIKYRGGSILERKVSVEGKEGSAVTVDNSTTDWGAPANTTETQSYADTVKAFCDAGTSKKVTVTYTARNQFNEDCTASYVYLIDNQAPVFKADSFTVNGVAADDNKWYKSSGFTVSGVWTDAGYNETEVNGYTHSSQINKVRYWITNTSTAPAAGASDNGTFDITADSVNKEFKLINKTVNGCVEGNNWVWFKAVDKAGNESDFVSMRLRIDGTAPELTLNQEHTIFVQDVDNFKVSGTLVDKNVSSNDEENKSCGLSTTGAVKVYQGTNTGTLLATKASVNADGTFEVSLPKAKFTGSAPYTITVYGYDANGNESSNKSFILDVDTTVPVVKVNGPVGRTGKQSLGSAENPVSLFGDVSDDKSGVKAVYYQILEATATATAPTNASSGWNTADGTTNWNKKETTARDKGKYKLYVYAEDNAGNKSTVAAGTPFDIDYEVPEIVVEIDGTENTETAEIVKTGSQFTYEATATDDWGTPALVVTKDGTSVTGLQTVTADGIYEFVATATDNVGKVTKVTRKIRLDKTAPVLEVTSPDLTSWQTSTSVNVKGSAIDATSKVSKVYWTTTKTTPAVGSGNNGTFTGWTEATGTSSWNFTLSGLTTDTDSKKFRLAAVDECGNYVVTEKTIKVDTTAPTVSIKAIDVNGTEKADSETADVILIGKNAEDKYNVEFTVADKYLDATPYTITITDPDGNDLSSGYTVTAKADNTSTSKTFTLAVTSPAQGLYTVSVNGKDKAGHTVPVSVKLNYDTEAPVISVQNLEDNQWITDTSYDVSGTTTDATGTAKVYWTRTVATPAVGTGNNGTFTGWTEATDDWKASLTGLTNTNGSSLKIAAVDTLGNYRVIEKTLKVDLKNPEVSLYTDSSCTKVLTGTPETNDAYTFYIKVSDKVSDTVAGSGIKSVTVNDAAATVVNATTGVYSYTQSKVAGNYTYKILVTDNAGRESQASASLIIDTTKPEVSDWTPSLTVLENGVNYVNGTIDLSFTIKDERKLASTFSYAIFDESNNEKVAATNVALTNIANETVTLSIDTTKLTDKKDNTVTVTAKDAAGNTKDFSYVLHVNQDTDCPYYETTSDVSLFGMSVWTINGKVKDDDGIKLVQVKIDSGSFVTKYDATKKDGNPDGTALASDKIVYSTERTFNYVIDGDNITEGAHKLTVLVTDKNGKTNTTVHKAVVNFNVDKAAPTVVPYKVNGSDYTAGMFVRKDFDIYLDANDANGVTSVKLIKVDDAAVTPVTLPKGTADGYKNYYLDALTNQANGNGKTRTYRVTDTYGRTADTTIRYNVDTVNPSVTATLFEYSAGNRTVAYDSTAKKWKVTENGNSKEVTSVSEVWFSSTSVSITSKDAVSDLNLVRGVTATVGGVDSDFNLVPADKDGTKKGSFAVSQALANGTQVPVKLTFKDEAGNTAEHTVNFKVDDVKPVLSEIKLKKGTSEVTSLNKADITNIATNKVTVSVKITDATSLVSAPTVKLYDGTRVVKNAAGTADLTATASSGTYTFEIPASALTDGDHTFKVVAQDNAGNEGASTTLALFVDTVIPVVTYVKPVTNTVNINKIIRLSGTIAESNRMSGADGNPELFIKKADNSWVSLGKGSVSGNTWEFTGVNTEGSNWTDKAENVLKVVFTDTAGNKSEDLLKLNVNQEADKPEIILNNISTDGSTTLNSSKIAGTITDDDATTTQVRKLEVKVVQENGNSAAIKGKTLAEGWADITPESGNSWSFELEGATDQTYTMSFRVTDWQAAETSEGSGTYSANFTTGSSPAPNIRTGSNTPVSTAVSFSYDKDPPVTGSLMYSLDSGEPAQLLNRACFGGPDETTLTVSLAAWDKIFKDNLSGTIKLGSASPVAMTKGSGSLSVDGKNETAAVFTYNITLGSTASGNLPITVTVTDGAGGSESANVQITVDNMKPTDKAAPNDGQRVPLSGVTPATTSERSNTVNVTGQASDDTVAGSGIAEIAYYLPPYSTGSASPKNPAGVTEWLTDSKISLSSAVFTLVLDNLGDYVGDQASSTNKTAYEDYETYEDSGIYDIPVWFRLTDAKGNTGYYTDYFIHYNPNADKPKVTVSSLGETVTRVIENEGEEAESVTYVTLGGDIVIRGTAEDDEGIDAVYLQFDINGDGLFNNTDRTWLSGKGYTVETIPGTTDWGIKANKTGQWNFTFDATAFSDAETTALQITQNDTTKKYSGKTLNIRARAVDLETLSDGTPNNQYASAWSEVQHVSINKNNPQFSAIMYVQQYTGSTYATAVAGTRKEYSQGMYLKGDNWCFEGSVQDPDGTIQSIEVSGTNKGTLATKSGWFTQEAGSNGKRYNFKIPVTDESGATADKFVTTIRAGDNSNPVNYTPYSVELNVDNTAPAFDMNAENKPKIYKGGYGGKNPVLNTTTTYLQNSNGATTIAGSVMDEQSGFEKMFVYAKRAGVDDPVNRIYNLMEPCGDDRNANRTNLTPATGAVVSIDSTAGSLTNGLPVLHVTSGLTKDGTYANKFTYAAGGTNKNLRAGGYVVINGRFMQIKEKTEEGLFELTEDIEGDLSAADFVYAMCIDNTNESGKSDGSIENDDGDGMVENWRSSGNNYIWSMEFDSSNIPDGPIELHFVVYDPAGNHADTYVETRVSNNAPRITHVRIATDLNQNGTIQDTANGYTEYTDFYAYKNSYGDADLTKGMEVWNLVPSDETESIGRAWTIKKDLALQPEFVGGTAPFYWVFGKTEGVYDGTNKTTIEATKDKRLTSPATGAGSGVVSANKINNRGTLSLDNDDIGSDGEDGMNTYHFTFWDSTEDSTPGTNTGWCILNVDMKQDLEDGTDPLPYVHPFYWKEKGPGKNSLAWDSTGEKAEGHIELEDNLTNGIRNASDGNSGTLGSDPKVSGKIVIRGTAYDETKLTGIKAYFDGIIDAGVETTFDGTAWTDGTGTGYRLHVTDSDGVTQKGHLVTWELELDTSKISNKTGINKKVKVYAKDKRGTYPVSSGTTLKDNTCTVYATDTQAAAGKYYSSAVLADADGDPDIHMVGKTLGTKGDADETYTTVYSYPLNETSVMTVYSSEAKAAEGKYFTDKGLTGTAVEFLERKVEKGSLAQAAANGLPDVYEYMVVGTGNIYQMDIVPYVTEVVTNLSAMKENNPSVYNRTALGHYPVQSMVTNAVGINNYTSEDVVLKGFNLGGTLKVQKAGNDSSKGYINGSTIKTAGTSSTYSIAGGNKTVKIELPVGNIKANGDICFNVRELQSGDGTITVNGIPVMNNLNNNNATGASGVTVNDDTAYSTTNKYAYNRVPNGDNNNRLTDDIVFDVWEFNDRVAKAGSNGSMSGLVMKINNSKNNMIQYAYVTSNKMTYMGDADYSAKHCRSNGDYMSPNSVSFAVDYQGTTYATSHGGDDTDHQYLYTNGAGTVELQQTSNDMKDQVYTPVIATSPVSPGTPYYAFYDKKEQQIRFSAGYHVLTANASRDTSSNCQVLAGGNAAAGGRNIGMYVSLAVTRDTIQKDEVDTDVDVVCVVWYNQAENKLQYSYNIDPIGSQNRTGNTNPPAGWIGLTDIFTGGGQYCEIAADAHGGIHIAASVGGEVKYAYASKYDSNFDVVTVDSGSVGKHLSLDVALENVATSGTAVYRPIPVIGYYAGQKKPKYAKLQKSAWVSNNSVTTEASFDVPDGYSSGSFTGSWEVNVVPVIKNLVLEESDKVFVGEWKYTLAETTANAANITGAIKNSYKTGTSVGDSVYSNAANNSCTSVTYGNGTSNGVLLYLTDGGLNMETAQMR